VKCSVAMKVAGLGAASALACAPAIDISPALPTPVVAFTFPSTTPPTASSTLDTVLVTTPKPQSVASLLSDEDSVQYMAAINVIASPDIHPSAPAAPSSKLDEPVTLGSIISYRFGESEPVVTCTVLRACVIELEVAEALVDDPIAGDQARWIITTARAGKGGASTLVIVKPKACEVTTNLVLSTDRRIYDLDLDSPPCPARATNPKRAYTRHIRFSYPNESNGFTGSPAPESTLTEIADSVPRKPGELHGVEKSNRSDTAWNTQYRVVRDSRGPFGFLGRKHAVFPWQPTRIADDGAHIYVSLPPLARKYPSPVLYALEDDDSRTIVNYNLRDSVIVTDRLFKRGVLVIPSGEEEQTLVFENRAWYDPPQRSEKR